MAQLLDTSGDVTGACRQALLDGAGFILWEDLVPASRILPAYERRAVHAVANGIPTLGFAEALTHLRSLGLRSVQIGQVTVLDPPYLFMIFLADDATAVAACVGIDQRRAPAPALEHS
jgi:hypothetical protein